MVCFTWWNDLFLMAIECNKRESLIYERESLMVIQQECERYVCAREETGTWDLWISITATSMVKNRDMSQLIGRCGLSCLERFVCLAQKSLLNFNLGFNLGKVLWSKCFLWYNLGLQTFSPKGYIKYLAQC